jgi:predicted outer membrane repeat protein
MNSKLPQHSVGRKVVQFTIWIALLAVQSLTANTITVTNTADNGPGSLRAALASATNGDTIDATDVSGTILLTSGELLVTNALTILGPSSASLAVNGNGSSRVFHIGSNTVVSLSSLIITNGSRTNLGASGGGIWNDHATLTINNCAIVGNSANSVGGSGGGIVSAGNLQILNSLLSNNAARSGGGIYVAYGTVAITNCVLSSNSASNSGGGINGSATLTIANSTISSNAARFFGGGISWYSGLTILNSTINGNTAGDSGGGVYADPQATVGILNSTFNDNAAAGQGGGVCNLAYWMHIANATFCTNTATQGGGIYSSHLMTIANSTLAGNSAPQGGGIYNKDGSLGIQSTILSTGALGSSITNDSGIVNSSGYNLSSDAGGGVLTHWSDFHNVDPKLGPLQDNGGPTLTMALRADSWAVDHGHQDQISLVFQSSTDQRGQPRTYDDPSIGNFFPPNDGDGTDIGAYEASPCNISRLVIYARELRMIEFNSVLGRNYIVQSRPSPVSGAWADLSGIIAGNGGIARAFDYNVNSPPTRFYRVKQQPQ